MNDIPFDAALEARFALEAACAPLAAERRTDAHLAHMRAEITEQRTYNLSDKAFCASDVRLHRALAEAAGNQVLAFQTAAAVAAMQPLMNMITYRLRDRDVIADRHQDLTDAVEAHDAAGALVALGALSDYTRSLAARRLEGRGARTQADAHPSRSATGLPETPSVE